MSVNGGNVMGTDNSLAAAGREQDSFFFWSHLALPVPEALHHGGLGPDHGQEGGNAGNVPYLQILTMPGAERYEEREGLPKALGVWCAWATVSGQLRGMGKGHGWIGSSMKKLDAKGEIRRMMMACALQ